MFELNLINLFGFCWIEYSINIKSLIQIVTDNKEWILFSEIKLINIPFFNLDEYINYLEIQRENGINCPVLFVQQENNAQGKDVYKIRPGPFDLQGGLLEEIPEQQLQPQLHYSNRSSNIYNKNNYPGFDPYSQEVGIYTYPVIILNSDVAELFGFNTGTYPVNPTFLNNISLTESTYTPLIRSLYPNRGVTFFVSFCL